MFVVNIVQPVGFNRVTYSTMMRDKL